MNLSPELTEISVIDYEARKGGKRKSTVNITVSSEILERVDRAAGKIGVARGDMLIACFLRVSNSYRNGNKKPEESKILPPLREGQKRCVECGQGFPDFVRHCIHCNARNELDV